MKISLNSQKIIFAAVSFLIKLQTEACNLIEKTLAQMLSFELCEIFKNTFCINNSGGCVYISFYTSINIIINIAWVSSSANKSLKRPKNNSDDKLETIFKVHMFKVTRTSLISESFLFNIFRTYTRPKLLMPVMEEGCALTTRLFLF